MMFNRLASRLLAGLFLVSGMAHSVVAQSVGLPAPRLLTVMPMGGQSGTSVPVTITGQSLDGEVSLQFSEPGISAVPQLDPQGKPVPQKFVVTIAPETPPGVYEARVKCRLGISSCRAFSVGTLPEVTRESPNITAETAMPLKLNSICNSQTTNREVDYFTFEAEEPTRVTIECAAMGIDSRLKPVLILANSRGQDLAADRRNGFLDVFVPEPGRYLIKIHGLTYEGGAESFYRLVLRSSAPGEQTEKHPSTQMVNVISVPTIVALPAATTEVETGDPAKSVQEITLPCDIAGAFFPDADVDTFEFSATKGETWWVEVVSERFGLLTNPFVLVQRVVGEGAEQKLVDLAELNDFPSPVKLSSNGYSYDGTYYDVGSADALGKFEIPEDGRYRLQLRDLYGGTRRDPQCVYRLIVRRANPDFALAAWAMHMELRNGDRNAVSKPIALRHGGAMIFEVTAARKDGFDGPIEVFVDDLPEGMSATGFTIPAGKSQGHLIISSREGASSVVARPKIRGRAVINENTVVHESRLASMAWPVLDAKYAAIPQPRLMADTVVSITGEEAAPLTIEMAQSEIPVFAPTDKIKIPLKLTWRGEFSGALSLRFIGPGFEKAKAIEVPLSSPELDVELDLEQLKLPPGDQMFALCGGLVIKYRYNLAAVDAATQELQKEKAALAALEAPAEAEEAGDKSLEDQRKEIQGRITEVEARLKAATAAAAPAEIVDIVVSEPIRFRINAPASP